MTSEVAKEIKDARPSLRIVSPLAYWIILIFGVFNILLGTTLYLALDQKRFTASLIIVNDVFTFQFWGLLFVTIGLLKLFSLYRNNWKLARNTLLMGISVKAAWAIVLTIRTFVSPGTLFLDFIWVALALIQITTYIFFMPPNIQPPLHRSKEDGSRG